MLLIMKKTAVGIAVCTLILTASISVLMGVMKTSDPVQASADVFIITQKSDPNPIKSNLDMNLAYAVENLSIADVVSPEIFSFCTLHGEPVIILGAIPDRILAIDDAKLVKGGVFRDSLSAMVGSRLAERMGLKVGSKIPLTGSFSQSIAEFTVVGIISSTTNTDNEVIVSLQAARELGDVRDGRISIIRVRTSDSDTMREILSPTTAKFIISNVTHSPARPLPGDTVSFMADVYNWGATGGNATVYLENGWHQKIAKNTSVVPVDETVRIKMEYAFSSSGQSRVYLNLTGLFPMVIDDYVTVLRKPLYVNGPLQPEVLSRVSYSVISVEGPSNASGGNGTQIVPVPYAQIAVNGAPYAADAGGVFNYTFPTGGRYELNVSKPNYEPVSVLVTALNRSTPYIEMLAPLPDSPVIRAGTPVEFLISDEDLAAARYRVNADPAYADFAAGYAVPTDGWSNGSYTITVTAWDSMNQTTTLSFNVLVDNIPPTVALISPADGSAIVPGTPVRLEVFDNTGIAAASCEHNGAPENFTAGYEVDTAGWAGGRHSLRVLATDVPGNVGSVNFSFLVDASVPDIALIAPANGSAIPPGSVISLNVSSPGGLALVQYSVDGGTQFSLPQGMQISTAGWADGEHSVAVYATGISGMRAARSFIFTIDGTAPKIALLIPADKSFVRAGSAVVVSVSDSPGSSIRNASYTVTNASGNVTCGQITNPFGYFEVNTSAWADGPARILVFATDVAGNPYSQAYSFTVDSAPPSILLSPASPPANSSVKPSKSVSVTVNDSHLRGVSYSVNGGVPITLASPYTIPFSAFADGDYEIAVNATDQCANTAGLMLKYTVDSASPTIELLGPPSGATITNGTPISFNITDKNGVHSANWRVFGYSAVNFSYPFEINTTSWSPGYKSLRIYADDGAGNYIYRYYSYVIDPTPDAIPPVIEMLSPANGSSVESGEVLDFNVWDDRLLAAAEYSVNGTAGPYLPFPSPFDLDTMGWQGGNYSVSVRASDSLNNTASGWWNITIDNSNDTAPPRVWLGAGGASNNSVSTPNEEAVVMVWDNTGVACVNWSADAGNWTAAAAPNGTFSIPLAGLSEGWHMVRVLCCDFSNNSRTATFAFYLDTAPPVIGLYSPANNTVMRGGTALRLNISDPTGISSQKYAVDGGIEFIVPASAQVQTKGWAQGWHDVAVRARDYAGRDTVRGFRVAVDDSVPDVSLVSPANNSDFYSALGVQLSVSDPNLESVNYSVNGGKAADLPSPYCVGIIASAKGGYSVKVTAADKAGNRAIRTYAFRCGSGIDYAAPQISILQPATARTIRPGTEVVFSVKDDGILVRAQYSINGDAGRDFAPGNYSLDTSGWGDAGKYSVVVSAADYAGNSAQASFDFTADSSPPAVSMPYPGNLASIYAGLAAQVCVQDSNPFSKINYTVDSGAWRKVPGPPGNFSVQTEGWSPGWHTVDVYAQDIAGNAAEGNFSLCVLEPLAGALGIDGLPPTVVNESELALTVTDLSTGAPVAGANVSFDGVTLVSDSTGIVRHRFTAVGTYLVFAQKSGYMPCYRSVVVYPASMVRIMSLRAVPADCVVGQEIDIIVTVDNSGESAGHIILDLYVDESPAALGRNVTLGGRTSATVIFKYMPQTDGQLVVRVNNMTAPLNVKSRLKVSELIDILVTLGPKTDMKSGRGPLMYELVDISKGNIMLVLVSLIIFASLLVTLGISSLLSKSVVEKRQVLGILKSIGASRWQVRGILVRETLMVAAPAAAVGIAGGIFVAVQMERAGLLVIFGQILYPITDIGFISAMFALVIALSLIPAVFVGGRLDRGSPLISVIRGSEKKAQHMRREPLEDLLAEDRVIGDDGVKSAPGEGARKNNEPGAQKGGDKGEAEE